MMTRYRMLFLSQKTFTVSAVCAFVLLPVGLLLTALSGQLTLFTAVCPFLCLTLCAGLFSAYRREDLIRVSGLVAGILLVELCRYAYLSERYLSVGVEAIVSLGLYGCMMLSGYLMVCFILLMIIWNHFTIHLGRNSGRTKMIANQISITVLLFCFITLVAENWLKGGSRLQQLAGAVTFLADLALFMIIACCDLYLAVDGQAMLAMHRGKGA